nr:MAG TPA_asm: hypothetical protein [Caudoviricetes sp.]DAQ68240.1 MAG TPA: hypothetical protein [Bacteriophage sp.]
MKSLMCAQGRIRGVLKMKVIVDTLYTIINIL